MVWEAWEGVEPVEKGGRGGSIADLTCYAFAFGKHPEMHRRPRLVFFPPFGSLPQVQLMQLPCRLRG